MKKFFAIFLVGFLTFTSVFAVETNNEAGKKVTISVDDESFSPKLFWLTPSGKGKFLGKGAGEYIIPEGSMGIAVTKFGGKVLWDDIANGDEYQIEKGNPGLNSLGITGTIVGSVLTGFGLGLGMVGLMDNDTSILPVALGTTIPGICVMTGGFILNYKFRPTFKKL